MIRSDLLLLTVWASLTDMLEGARRRTRGAVRDRGDIPGWVMIAIMSAAVVVVLIPFVGPIIGRAFANAVNHVSNTNSNTGP